MKNSEYFIAVFSVLGIIKLFQILFFMMGSLGFRPGVIEAYLTLGIIVLEGVAWVMLGYMVFRLDKEKS